MPSKEEHETSNDADRRAPARKKTFLGGVVVSRDGSLTLDCTSGPFRGRGESQDFKP